MLLELGTACHRAGKALDALEAFRAAAEIAPRAGRRRSCSRAPRSATRRRAGGPGIADAGRGRAARGGGGRARRRELGAARRRCSAGSPARSTSRATTSAAAIVRDAARSRWRGGSDDRAGLATVAGALLLVARHDLAGRDPRRCSPRPGRSARSSATPRSAPRRWRGASPAFVALCDLDVGTRARSRSLRATAEQTAQPFMLHVAEHYGSAIALCDGRLDGGRGQRRCARTSGAGC